MDDTRARFLSSIADRLGADHIVELHLFSPIRQGVLETGVAVVAVLPAEGQAADGAEAQAQCGAKEQGSSEAQAQCGAEEVADNPTILDPVPESLTVPVPVPSAEARHVVFTARYRLTRKGPDRGKWLFELAATADAPLATVDAVARGVTQRSKDLTESERLSGDQLRTLLGDPLWRTPK